MCPATTPEAILSHYSNPCAPNGELSNLMERSKIVGRGDATYWVSWVVTAVRGRSTMHMKVYEGL